VTRAFELAISGRPGPVVVTLPEDLLELECIRATPEYVARTEIALPEATCAAIEMRLRAATRPVLWVGGSGWSDEGVAALRQFAEQWRLPVVSGFRRKDLVSNGSEGYIGELGFVAGQAAQRALAETDLLLVVGASLGDVETGGYTRLDPAATGRYVIHIAMRELDVGRVFPVSLGAVASPSASASALAKRPAPVAPIWDDWVRALRRSYESDVMPVPVAGSANLSEVFLELRRQLPDDAIVTNGAGNYAAWLHRFFESREYRTQLAPQSGAMGYGVPAAIAAALVRPDRCVVAVSGDGCFLMAAQDLVTAAREGARVVFLVINNGLYGTIRMHQAMRFPERPMGTVLGNPDFVALAEASGIPAVRVETHEQFGVMLSDALRAAGPRLIEIVTSAEDIAPGRRLSAREIAAS
jgi:acetolactate synthase-1/2/3 large subunit